MAGSRMKSALNVLVLLSCGAVLAIDMTAKVVLPARSLRFLKSLEREMNATNLEDNLRYLSEKPHVAGSNRNNKLAQWMADRWTSYGFDDITIPKYNILLSLPDEKNITTVQVVDRKGVVKHTFQQKEKPLSEAERNNTLDLMPSFLSNPLTGEAQGDVVYANYGTMEDFDKLKKLGEEVKGKIALMRMGRGYRGNKVRNAASNGAIGALVYTDPEEFAPEGADETYPKSWWLPDTGVQRGAAGLGAGPGDALTPGYPSVEGIYRKPLDKIPQPKIPAFELPYKDALYILRRLGGPDAPEEFQGKLPITYKRGPGFKDKTLKIKMSVKAKSVVKPIFDVVGTIKGREEPDRYVIIGNHRDAWAFGASDPSSGTAILMELARGLGKLLEMKWRPRRTIMLCSWDAEEQFVSGSTEWVEEHAQILSNRAVVYLNVDIGVGGKFALNIDGTPLIENLLVATAKEVQDPTALSPKATIYDVIVERDSSKLRNGVPVCANLAFGSDYVAFYHFLGVTSADWSYIFGAKKYGIRRSYPVYHSIHDNFHWLKTFIDPHFKLHLAVAKYTSYVVMKMADAKILPYNVTNLAVTLQRNIKLLKRLPEFKQHSVSLKALCSAVEEFYDASVELDREINNGTANDELSRRVINDQLMSLERVFIDTITPDPKLPFRNVLFGPDWSNIYHGYYFPQIRDALKAARTDGDWEQVKKAVSVLTFSVRSGTQLLKKID